jgi:serine/threonine-protein kinase
MSPEQAKGSKDVDARSDLWSMGIVLHEMLCGTAPHAHITTMGALIVAICSEPPAPVQSHAPWVPPGVAAIVHRALALDPARRFQSAAEMHGAIVAVLGGRSAIDEASLAPLASDARASVAPRFDPAARRGGDRGPTRTTDGVVARAPKLGGRRAPWAWVATAVVVTAAGGAALLLARPASVSEVRPAAGLVVPATSEPATTAAEPTQLAASSPPTVTLVPAREERPAARDVADAAPAATKASHAARPHIAAPAVTPPAVGPPVNPPAAHPAPKPSSPAAGPAIDRTL